MDDIVDKLTRTPLYEGAGEESSLGEEAKEEIDRLRAEVKALKREASNNLDIAERHMNEKHKAWEALRKIRDRRSGPRWTVVPNNAFSAFNRLNDEMLAIFAECDAALEESRT